MSLNAPTTLAKSEEPYVVEDCRGLVKLMSDGTVIRSPHPPFPVQSLEPNYPFITWADHTFDTVHDLQLRLYKPGSSGTGTTIIMYIHGGGFCLGSRALTSSHNLCLRLAAELGVVVVSVDYRLAPENRLPAAFEDCWTALKWVKEHVCGDYGQGVFLFGDSAGGSLAHNLAVRVASGGLSELEPVRVKGCVLLAPAFVGSEPTKSELEAPSQTFLNLQTFNRFGRLALPIGETVDYPLLNPFGPRSPSLELIDLPPMLVMVGDKDILLDRIKDYATRLSGWGKQVKYVEFEGLEHGFLVTSSDEEPAKKVVSVTKSFVSNNSA